MALDQKVVADMEGQVAQDLVAAKTQRDPRIMRLFALAAMWLQEEREANDLRRGDDLKEGQGRAQALNRLVSFHQAAEAFLARVEAGKTRQSQPKNGAT